MFLTVAPGRNQNRRLVNLEGYDDASEVIEDIIDGSMGDGEVVGLDRVYTGLEIKYDKNPANGEYRSTVFVRKTSEDSFPGIDEVVSGTDTPLWTTYAGGFLDYPTALTVWDAYHAAYLVTRRENVYKMEIDWFQKNSRIGLDSTVPDAPVYLALILSGWYSQPRKRYTFEVPVTTASLARQLGDRVIIRDLKRTNDLYFKVIIEGQMLITKENKIKMTVSHRLNDTGTAASPVLEYITESVGGNTITESTGVSTTITEVVN
jgi:hypothetical protein